MAKALFYHPDIEKNPLITAPLAFLHLTTSLKRTRHEITLIDGRLVHNQEAVVIEELRDKDVLLISAMPGSQIRSALKICREARKHYPGIPILWGGSHPSSDPERTAASEYVDGVVIGRGEDIIGDILDSLDDPAWLRNIPNTIFKDNNGSLIKGPEKDFMYSSPVAPDYSLLGDIEPYICQTRKSRRMIDSISSFGCPNSCSFCYERAVYNGRWVGIDAHMLVEQIEYLKNSFDIDGVLFQDANFVVDRKRLVDFCNLLSARTLGIGWISTARLSDIDDFHKRGYLRLMRDSGCEMLFLGAEAASEQTIKKYKKGINAEETAQLAELLWNEYDIFPHFSYVISYPIETMEDVQRTLDLHSSICDLVNSPTGELGFYTPTMGTPFLEENRDVFKIPQDLEGWADFDFLNQNLYANPCRELEKVLFRHHLN